MRILILDDNAALAQVLGVNLRAEGLSVLVFTSPSKALRHVHEADVLVTKYHMPEMTGLEVARRAYEQGWRGSLFMRSDHASGKNPATLGNLRGWLDDDDPFFGHLETVRNESRREKLKNPFGRKK